MRTNNLLRTSHPMLQGVHCQAGPSKLVWVPSTGPSRTAVHLRRPRRSHRQTSPAAGLLSNSAHTAGPGKLWGLPAGRFGAFRDQPQRQTFMHSLICNVPDGVQLLTCAPGGEAATGGPGFRARVGRPLAGPWQMVAGDLTPPFAQGLAGWCVLASCSVTLAGAPVPLLCCLVSFVASPCVV